MPDLLTGYYETKTHLKATVSVVGTAPTNTPYLRIEDGHGVYLGTIDGDDLVALRDAITAAIKGRNRG